MGGTSKLGRRYRKKKRSMKYGFCRQLESCSHEEDVVKLRQWMKQKSGFKNCLVPALFSDTGRGLMTKKSISPGDVIVSIPHSLLITTKTVLESEIGHFIKRWKPKLSPQQCLSVFLVWERHKHSTSTWFPYINLLPPIFSTPAYFSQTELTYLPKSVRLKSAEQIAKLQDTFDKVKHFTMLNWNEFYDVLTFDMYRWAWYVINTRSVYYQTDQSEYLSTDEPDTMALAPFLDLLNHSPTADIKAGINSDGSCYEIVTFDKYQAYDQVFISYGCHSSQTLFIEYGFCVPNHPYDELEVLYDDMIKACNHYAVEHMSKKLSLLQEHGLLKSAVCTKEGMSWKLLTVFKTLAMDWNQLRDWNQVFTDEKAFQEVVPVANKLASFILQQYLTENKQLETHVKQTVSNRDNKEHVDSAKQLIKIERDILVACLPS